MPYNTKIMRACAADILDVMANTVEPRFVFRKNKINQSKFCYACGQSDKFKFMNIINDELSNAWGLTKSLRKSFDIRESTKCENCGSSFRSNLHAHAICKILTPSANYLADAINLDEFRKLKIAEINACGALHKILAGLPNLKYSEYMPVDEKVRHENLDKLSYKSSSFDVVFTSETLEHVPDWRQAKQEIHRVLKLGGKHIFTVPAILTRQTRVRAIQRGGKVKHLLPRSYHGYNRNSTSDYIVFNEFGADFRHLVDELGFSTKIYYRNVLRLSDPSFVFVSTKV